MKDSITKTFSIITPSYNMLGYLKRCCASIADQNGISFEHIVVDGASSDDTPLWLKEQSGIKSISEPDDGMYQAINKGFRLASGEIYAYLNCDEQYLPDTLRLVKEYFDSHKEVDVVFGDMLVVNNDGSLIAYRKSFKPRWYYIESSYLYVFTCTMFIRRSVVDRGFLFDERFKGIGDAEFVVRLLRNGISVGYINKYLSAFTITGNNLCMNNLAFLEEKKELKKLTPAWTKLLKLPLNFLRLSEKFIRGAYYQRVPLVYELYDNVNLNERRKFLVNNLTFRLEKNEFSAQESY